MELKIKHIAKIEELLETYYSSCIVGEGVQLIKIIYQQNWNDKVVSTLEILSPYSNCNSSYLKEKIEDFNNNLLKIGFFKLGTHYKMDIDSLTYKDFKNLLNIIKELLE